jgi:pimeloyl-ACP methyl ester carboxylesterase
MALTEFVTSADGIRIAYESVGEGIPVLLLHGFASSRVQNWRGPGWYATLTAAGYRVIALDFRGHGESDKPHDPDFYSEDKLEADALAVIRAADASPAFIMGYSMGGFISMRVLLSSPELVRKVVLGGVGESYFDGRFEMREKIADALEADDTSKITDPTAKTFRNFAEQQGKDLLALAACMRGRRIPFKPAQLSYAQRPVLAVCGEDDKITGSPGPLAAAFAHGRAVSIANRDHMTTVGDKLFKQAALDFFKE